MNTELNTTRISAIHNLMSIYQNRRTALKAAAAAGLIPVLATNSAITRAAAQDATPQAGGTYVMISQANVDSLSAEDVTGGHALATVQNIFDPLYSVNEYYELDPYLAESHEVSEDGLTYTFKLRTGVKFHNGDDFSSEDVLYTYNWIMDEANASTQLADFELVESIEAPDATTVVVTLSEVDASFLVNTATNLIRPAKYHAEIGEDEFKAKPIGTGPFKPIEWSPQERVLMEAYDDYFLGRPNIDFFQVDVVPEAAGRTSALETLQADSSFWYLNAEDNIRLMDSGDFTVFEVLQVTVNHFPLNNTHPFLSDQNVRRALLHALDRQAIADELFLGQAQIAHSNMSPAVEKWYNPDVQQYEYDIDLAKSLLDEAGWTEGSDGIREKEGVRAEFTMMLFQGDTQRRPIAEVAQQWWMEIGVEMILEEGVSSDVLNGLRDGEHDAGLFNWVYGGTAGDPDARSTLATGAPNNFFQYSNEEVDQLLQDGIRELDEDARRELYFRIQEIISEELPFLPLITPQQIVFFTNRVKGLPETMTYPDAIYKKLYSLWLEQ